MNNDMWLVDVDRPWREPFFAYGCKVKICEKQIVVFKECMTLRRGGYTFIYGSSAFGTYEAAQRRRRNLLRKLIAHFNSYGGRYRHNSHDKAVFALILIERES